MFAVIKTGGKQYRVAANDEFEIERVPGEAGDQISFKEVLMIGTTIGAPFVSGASVVAEIVEQTRGPKVISFKKRRRQNSKRTRGHRQDLTLVRIGEILTDGKGPSEKPKKAAKKADVAVDETTEEKAVKAKAEKDEAKPLKAAAVTDDTETAAKPKPAKKAKENGVIDIDGIGPVFRDRLAEHGVTTLEQIAALDDAGIDALNETADLQGQIRADDWVGQAKALIAENAKASKA